MNNCVYKITNLINNKIYIGSTNNFQRRMREHKVYINCNSTRIGYNNPLYRAFRKYGLDNFQFEIIINNIDTLDHARELEHNKIIEYNCLAPNGYNLTENTIGPSQQFLDGIKDKTGIRCALVDINDNIIELYPSIREANRKNNCTNVEAVCSGKIYSSNGKLFRYIINDEIVEISYNGTIQNLPLCGLSPIDETKVYCSSLVEASQISQVSTTVISQCLNGKSRYSVVGGYIWRRYLPTTGEIIENNLLVKDVISAYNKKYILYNGKRQTLHEWCTELQLDYDKVRYQMKYKNKTFEEAISLFQKWGV